MSPRFTLINQECALFHFCISTGLTQLRRVEESHKGAVYVGLFNLSIGLERILKLIVIADYWLSHNQCYPSKAYMRTKGHKLVNLATECEGIIRTRKLKAATFLASDAINALILETISHFAEGSRYANLDNLEQGLRNNDPLNKWANILEAVFKADVSLKARKLAILWPIYLTEQTKAFSAVATAGFDGSILNAQDQLTEQMVHKACTPYISRRICQIIKPFKLALDELFMDARQQETSGESFPYSADYLNFLHLDNKALLKKTTFTR